MTLDDFRMLALSMPDAEERAHLGAADVRVNGKIFATLGASTGRPVLKLLAEEQTLLVEAAPEMFAPDPSRWGRHGWTQLVLDRIDEATAQDALSRAWRNVSAPQSRRRRAGV